MSSMNIEMKISSDLLKIYGDKIKKAKTTQEMKKYMLIYNNINNIYIFHMNKQMRDLKKQSN